MVNSIQEQSMSGVQPTVAYLKTHSLSTQLRTSPELIYQYFLNLVKTGTPEQGLDAFEQLFFHSRCPGQPEVEVALEDILSLEQGELQFRGLIKRCCYILINNFLINRQQKYIKKLIQKIQDYPVQEQTFLSDQKCLLSIWVSNFIESEDYGELIQCTSSGSKNWSSRYQSYLLISQYANPRNSREQKEAARHLAQQLKDQYKFNLALYIARSESPAGRERIPPNPTQLGDEVIKLIKHTISTQRVFNYANQANLFLNNTKNFTYQTFKYCLPQYLIYNFGDQYPANIIKEKLEEKLDFLYVNQDENPVTKALIIRTCNRLIEYLLIEQGKQPGFLFNLMLRQGHQLTLVILLLKLVLIASYCRTYLETCIANLIQFYQDHEEEQCQGFIHFIEVFNLVFTLFTENVQYCLVKVKDFESSEKTEEELETYRLFCQFKGPDLRNTNLKQVHLKGNDLRGADLRDTDLQSVKFTQVDLSLAKLTRANLSHGILRETKFFIANLNYANLTDANLIKADFRRAELRQTNLTCTNLTEAKFNRADLKGAILNRANLTSADFENADLREANLSYSHVQNANFINANLEEANLTYTNLCDTNLKNVNFKNANLEGADLRGADLTGVNLEYANLKGAILDRANLTNANLTGAILTNASLTSTCFDQANLSDTVLVSVNLRDASLKYSNLRDSNLTEADLTRANLIGCDLSYAKLKNAIVRHTELKDAILVYTDLRGANLFRSNITQAQLTGIKMGNNTGLSDRTRMFLGAEEIS